MSRCATCRAEHNRDERHRIACRRCERRTREDLTSLAGRDGWYTRLVNAGSDALTLGQVNSRSQGGGRSTSPNERLPVRSDVINLIGPGGVADTLRFDLLAWYVDLEFELPALKGPQTDRFDQLVTRLVNCLPWAAENRADWREFSRRVAKFNASCKHALDPTQSTPRVPVGRCPAEVDEEPCGSKLTADPFADHIRCYDCGSVWYRSEWMALGAVLAGN